MRQPCRFDGRLDSLIFWPILGFEVSMCLWNLFFLYLLLLLPLSTCHIPLPHIVFCPDAFASSGLPAISSKQRQKIQYQTQAHSLTINSH